MRDLTTEEIENAPEWADSVFENGHGALCWFSNDTGLALRIGSSAIPVAMSSVHYSFKTNKPIHRKEFDISEHKLDRCDDKLVQSGLDLEMCRHDNYANPSFNIRKQDVIAMAKHFKLTASDLS